VPSQDVGKDVADVLGDTHIARAIYVLDTLGRVLATFATSLGPLLDPSGI
jgi:hypothetical protein